MELVSKVWVIWSPHCQEGVHYTWSITETIGPNITTGLFGIRHANKAPRLYIEKGKHSIR